jgi:ferredoxin/flavodoxin---NADP+ reductase
MDKPIISHSVAIIGAGPAGLYAAQELAISGVQVVLFNRDIKPGGLAEYGIHPEKLKMKQGLRNQFRQILTCDQVTYYGNVVIGKNADFRLDELRNLGFQAILVTTGAQGTKWLGLPGEQYSCVYHAKELVYHYNNLPPFSQQAFCIGRRVAVVGVGNVMTDVVSYLISQQVEEVITVARRGPAEVKFGKKELEGIKASLDVAALDAEIERVAPIMVAVGEDPAEPRAMMHSIIGDSPSNGSKTHLKMHFLASPTQIIGDEDGRVTGLEIEDNSLVCQNDEFKAVSLGTRRIIPIDTVIFAIGDRVDNELGLPINGNEYAKNPFPRFPTDGFSYEAYDPEGKINLGDIFVAGWSRKASAGLVGVARRDGTNGARVVLKYLADHPGSDGAVLQRLDMRLKQLKKPVISWADVERLISVEKQRADQSGLEDFKFASNHEMLVAMGL